jgi:hypothetical protein
MATKTRFEVALEGALHLIRQGLRLALGELSHGPDEPEPAMFDAIDVMLDSVTCNVEALIETAEPA